MPLIAALITGCDRNAAPEQTATSVSLEVVSVGERALTFDVTVESSETLNFAYLQCTSVSTGEGRTEMLPENIVGTNRVQVSGLPYG